MNPRLSWTTIALALLVVCGLVVSSRAQQPNFLVPVELNGQTLRGSAGIAKIGNEGMIGIDGKLTETGYKVESVRPNLPAAIAGIQPGDIIVSLDGTPLKDTTQDALKPVASKRDGETLSVGISRNGESRTVLVKVGIRKNLLANDSQWVAESKMPPGVMQFLFGGSAAVVVAMAEAEQFPNHLRGHLKTGQRWSGQNRPTEVAGD
jgi:membrane-associated protease RseP (regulator of RpoE activity)